MSIIAVDPGITNMGIWVGRVTPDGVPVTRVLGTYNVGREMTTAESPLAFLDRNQETLLKDVKDAVVETQQCSNTMARTVADVIYGYLRGRGINCKYSSSSLKNNVIRDAGEQFKITSLVNKVRKADGYTQKQVMSQNYRANKLNSVIVAREILRHCGDLDNLAKIDSADKKDDMCDALLLGIGHGKRLHFLKREVANK